MRTAVAQRTGALLLVTALAGCALAGCAPTSAAPTFAAENSEPACADWAWYDSVDEAASSAELVVRAELEPTDVAVTMHGEQGSMHRARVTEVFVGDASVGDELDVLSTPASCTAGAPYPDGDPMLRDEATLVLGTGSAARGSADFVQTITPYAGVWDERPTGS